MSAPFTHSRLLTCVRWWRCIYQPWMLVMLAVLIASIPIIRRSLANGTRTEKSPVAARARLSETVSVKAPRDNPAIHLSDGHELLTSYVGRDDLRVALEQNQAEPLSLASADFDEDGVPDLVSGYGYNGEGIVTLLRGNVDSIYPNAPEAQQRKANGTFTNAPFLSPANIFPAPVAADFIGAGDFDADGHWDVVVASRTRNSLYLLSGDGRGNLSPTKEVQLPGVVTAMTTGEVNRADGLTDIVVGVDGFDGAKALVIEGPNGALNAQPEVLTMPGVVTALALGQLDDSYEMDLAVGTGTQLVVVHGRDRKLSLDESLRAKVPAAVTSSRILDDSISSLVIGDFIGDDAQDIAILRGDGNVQILSQSKALSRKQTAQSMGAWQSDLLSSGTWLEARLVSARVSALVHDDLVIVDAANQQLQIVNSGATRMSDKAGSPHQLASSLDVASEPVAVLPTRLNGDALSDLTLLTGGKNTPVVLQSQPASTFVVTNTNANGPGSLLFAITDANETPGADLIAFNIPGPSPHVINQTVPLPTVTDPVTIDGTTQPDFVGNPTVEVQRGSSTSDGIVISAGSSRVRGLAFSDYGVAYGVRLQGNGTNVIDGNVFTDLNGGGMGGFIGVFAPNNLIGGTVAASRNLLAGLQCADNSGGNNVVGNFVNLNLDGSVVANGLAISITNSGANTVGGTVAGATNVIATGAFIITEPSGSGSVFGNLVQGNYVGTNPAGTVFSHPDIGIELEYHANNNTIGGTTSAARNVIAGSGLHGIVIAGSVGNQVQGNYIGTDVTGTSDRGNAFNGVYVTANFQVVVGFPTTGNIIGGTVPGTGNVISGNGLSGVLIEGAQTTGNLVQGNFIGTNAGGTAALGNDLNGVTTSEAPNNTIGGATTEARNIISANARHGVSIGIDTNSGSTGITVQNNYIGTDVTGNNCLGNQRDGVFVNRGSVSHTIVDNLITCNGRNGVNIPNFATNDPGIRIQVIQNLIYANAALGIDLGDAGITPNTADGLPRNGEANLRQNFPVLTSVTGAASRDEGQTKRGNPEVTVSVNGALKSTPNTAYTVHWYFSADAQCVTNQQSSRPLVSGKVPNVITNGNGDAAFNFPLDLPVGVNNGIVNCTATDPQGNTSEFSACLPVNGAVSTPPSVAFDAASYTAAEDVGSKVLTVTRTGNPGAAFAVNYSTSDTAGTSNCNVVNTGAASARCDYETKSGTLKFAAGETSKTISIDIVDDAYAEGNESFAVTLSNATGATLGSPSSATVTITDNETTTGANPISDARYFVRLHYTDFLNRDPDTSGWDFWTNQITACGSDAGCTEVKRINVSVSFFLSIEFQQTGYLVERTYKVAYGDAQGNSTFQSVHQLSVPVIRLNEFMTDTSQISEGVIVGQGNWQQQLENNKVAFFNDFVQRSRFVNAFPTTMTPTQFIDALNVNAGNVLSASEKTAAVNLFGGAGNTTNVTARAQALRQVAEDADLNTAEFNRAFVLMQYFGYLRRNPNDPQDSDYTGYDFWLTKLNQFGGNYINAEMVKAFISSMEYNARFGP